MYSSFNFIRCYQNVLGVGHCFLPRRTKQSVASHSRRWSLIVAKEMEAKLRVDFCPRVREIPICE
jgi:hypothetical protein